MNNIVFLHLCMYYQVYDYLSNITGNIFLEYFHKANYKLFNQVSLSCSLKNNKNTKLQFFYCDAYNSVRLNWALKHGGRYKQNNFQTLKSYQNLKMHKINITDNNGVQIVQRNQSVVFRRKRFGLSDCKWNMLAFPNQQKYNQVGFELFAPTHHSLEFTPLLSK